jgi:iron complex transport system substrate-binding protein
MIEFPRDTRAMPAQLVPISAEPPGAIPRRHTRLAAAVALAILFCAAAAPAQNRIVSTAPAITETLFALGLGDRVAGVSTYCHYPPEAMSRPKIGTYLKPNIEQIVRLRPDLVIVEQLAPALVRQLESSGARVAEITTGNVGTNLEMIEQIGRAAGVAAKGAELAGRVRSGIEAIRKRSLGRPRTKVVFIVGRTPGRLDGLIAAGNGAYLNELLEAAGGDNIFASSSVTYPKVSLESILRLQPGLIIDMGEMADTEGVTGAQKRSVADLWRRQKGIGARVEPVASDIFVVPGPRMLDAAAAFEKMIRGSAGP